MGTILRKFNLKHIVRVIVPMTTLLMCYQNCSPMGEGASDSLNSQSLGAGTYQALEDQVASTFSNRCVSCHSSVVGNSSLPFLNDLENLKLDQIYVKRGLPLESAVFVSIINAVMPENGPDLTSTAPLEVQALRDWIQYMP